MVLALACWGSSPAAAATFTVSNETELRNAINAANASPDASSTIVMTQNVGVLSTPNLPTSTKNLTIDTNGFVLSGVSPGAGTSGSVFFSGGTFSSGTLTITGTVRGADQTATGAGSGLVFNSGVTTVGSPTGQVVNNGSITGGAGNVGGLGVSLLNVVTFVNNGTVSGGAGTGGGLGNNMAGVNIFNTGATLINNATGLIQGGNSSAGGQVGAGVFVTTSAAKPATITNFGTIRGGSDLSGAANGSYAIRGRGAGLTTINNFGTLEGGNGAAAIGNDGGFPWGVTVINAGTIRAGTGATNAINFARGSTNTLELWAGSNIIGNVVGGINVSTDILRLGGSADSSFDVSAIGTKYQNFEQFQKSGTSTWTLTGTGSVATPWDVQAGTLLINGTSLGNVTVASSATLGGTGTIGGNVDIASGATLAPGVGTTPGTLTINGNLGMANGSQLAYKLGQANLPGGIYNDLVNVNGDLALNGTTLNVTTSAGGSFDPGVYRIISYTGTLTNSNITVGTVPSSDFTVQTAIPNQINLVNTAGLTLNFWDGPSAPNNGVIEGSTGTWQAAGDTNWTNRLGVPNAAYAAGAFAIFQGTTGINVVTVDNSQGAVIASGMQFVGPGYVVRGGDITLTGSQAVIRVGDGTAGSAFLNATIASNLIGSAQLVKSDLGTLALTGTNTYSGGTLISAGTLMLGNNGTSGSIVGDVVNNGKLSFYRSDAVTFGGAISGTGSVAQIGTGTTTLTGTNTYSGGTDIGNGTLIGQAASFGSGRIANNAALIIDQPVDAILANQIIGTGSLTKRGAGNLILTGTGTMNGATMVEAGKLSVNGTFANTAVSVLSGATIGGIGTIGGLSVASGGIAAPGNSIGTLNVSGDVSFAAGSFYQVEANAAGQSDKIVATGKATLSGGSVLALAQTGTYSPQTVYTILTANTGVNGTFADVTSSLTFLTPSLTYDLNNVYLTFTRTSTTFPDVAQTPNQRTVSSALQASSQTSPLVVSILNQSTAGARQAFDALSGEVHASAQTAMLDDARYLRDAVLGRLRQSSSAGDTGPMAALGAGGPQVAAMDSLAASSALAYASTERTGFPIKAPPLAAPARIPDTTFWAQGVGAWGRYDGDGNAAGMKRDLAGFFSGVDHRFAPNWIAGIAGGYTNSSVRVRDRASSANIDTAHLAGYVGASYGALNLRGGAGASFSTVDTSRSIVFPNFFDTARARYNATTAQVFGEVGYGLSFGQLALEPFAGLAWAHLGTNSFGETGGSAALLGSGNSEDVGYSTLGARFATNLVMANGMLLTPRASVSWQHAFGDVTPTATLAFRSLGANFTTAGVPLARNAALVESGLDLRVTSQASIGVAYVGQIADRVQDHSVKGSFTWRF